jgi:hypothetical protein
MIRLDVRLYQTGLQLHGQRLVWVKEDSWYMHAQMQHQASGQAVANGGHTVLEFAWLLLLPVA